MLVVVSYDITDDRRRTRVAKTLAGFGTRVQYSVFDCLLNEKQLARLRVKLEEIIDQRVDSVRFYRLCSRCRSAVVVLGTGPILDDEEVLIV